MPATSIRRKTLTGTVWRPPASVKKQLETSGDMELLLQGKETEIAPLKLRTPVISLTMDATLKLVPDGNGRPVMEINGLRQKETPEI